MAATAEPPDDHGIVLRPLVAADWPAVDAIYRAGIATGHATFEDEPPTWEHFDRSRLADHRLVAVDAGERCSAGRR